MRKWSISLEAKRQIEGELDELALISNYISKTGQENEKFTSISRRKEFVLLDGAVRVPKILLIENSKGVTEILNRFSREISPKDVDSLSKKTGLNREDIASLMQDGMDVSDIELAADNLPFKDIAESAAIREMIRKGLSPEQLEGMKKKGVNVKVLENGGIVQETLIKIAEVDKDGIMHFDQDWFEKNLKPFAEIGLINISDQLVLKDVRNTDSKEIGALQVVPLQRKKDEKDKEEVQKQEVAKTIGVDSDEILSVIRIEDRDGGSKLFNYDLEDKDKPLIVRLKNNKFRVLNETENGDFKEVIGYEATPVSKQIAHLLRDTSNEFTSLKPGDVKAGKTNPDQAQYDIFQIRRAGESKDDDLNNLLYVSCSGKTDMNVIESRDNGEVRFGRVPQSSIYPENIYLENDDGVTRKREITYDEPENKSVIDYEDIEKRREIIEKLLEVESEIAELEESKSEGAQEQLTQLYSDRTEYLNELDISEKEVVDLERDYEEYTGRETRPRA